MRHSERAATVRLAAALSRLMLIGLLIGPLAAAGPVRPTPVSAHAEVERSVPVAESVVTEPPAIVELWFTEEMDAGHSTIVVVGPEGARVDMGDAAVDLYDPRRLRMTVSLRPGLTAGGYTVHWRTTSAEDDDEAFGSFPFDVAIGAPGCEGRGPDGSPSPTSASTPEATPVAPACVEAPPEGTLDTPIMIGGTSIELSAGSGAAGPVDLTVRLADAAGSPVDDAVVTVRARHIEMDHGEFPKPTTATGAGTFVAEGVGMGMGGSWRVAVDVVRPGQLPVTAFFLVELEGLS